MKNKIYIKFTLVSCLFLIIFSMLLPSYSFAEAKSSPTIYSPSVILMDFGTGKILYEKNSNKKMYPASITKVMTAIIVLEKCKLDDVATVSYEAVMELDSGYVTANLQIGEKLTIEQLLNVLIVASSNDAAIVLAEHVSGSVENFSSLMNTKAKEIGCKNTNFVNPNGAHNKNHYSTAYDLALMGKYAMQNETFRELVQKTSYSLPTTNKYSSEDRLFTTTNSLLIVNNNDRADNYYYKYATGIKTGFTTPAGNCLLASSKKDTFELITVVLNSGETNSGLSERFLDTLSLFEYGYSTYTIREISKNGSIMQTININNATRDTKRLDIVLEESVSVLTKRSTASDAFLPEIKLNENLKAPIKKDEVVGTITYHVEDISYTYNLLAKEDVVRSKVFIKFLEIIFVIFIVLVFIRMRNISKRKKRLQKRKIK